MKCGISATKWADALGINQTKYVNFEQGRTKKIPLSAVRKALFAVRVYCYLRGWDHPEAKCDENGRCYLLEDFVEDNPDCGGVVALVHLISEIGDTGPNEFVFAKGTR